MTLYLVNGEIALHFEHPDQVRHVSGRYMGKATVGEQIHPNGDVLTKKDVSHDPATGLWGSHVQIKSTNGASREYHSFHPSQEAAEDKTNNVLSQNMIANQAQP